MKVLRRETSKYFSAATDPTAEKDEDDDGKAADELMEYFKVFIEGRDAVNQILKRMSDILEDKINQGHSEEEAIFMASAIAAQENLETLDRRFLLALDVELKNAAEENVEKKVLVALKEQVLLQLTMAFPPHVRVVSIMSSTADKEQRKQVLCQAIAGGGLVPTVDGGSLEIPAADLQSVTRQADDLISAMEEKTSGVDRKLLSRLVLVREEAQGLVSGGVMDGRHDTRKFRNVPSAHVDFMSELMQLKGKPLTEKLFQVLSGEEDMDSTKEEAEASGKRVVLPGSFLDSLTRINKQMYATESGKGIGQLQWVRRESLNILQRIAFPPKSSSEKEV